MIILHSLRAMRSWVVKTHKEGRPIAFVPTMGALHQGHLSLVERARKEVGKRGRVVVSIFVNPTQFNQKSDLAKYPRQLGTDASMCRSAGADVIFAPAAREMYPVDFSTWVEEADLAKPLCGATRPGHFRGVCTVVLKLFNIVQPGVAIFGAKDAQQARVIRRMIRDLNVPVRIIIAPTLREKDGLAMSSRNRRLSKEEWQCALHLQEALKCVRAAFRKGEKNAAKLKSLGRSHLAKTSGIRLDYLELVDEATLKNIKRASKGNLLAVAAFVGKTRLIDNLSL